VRVRDPTAGEMAELAGVSYNPHQQPTRSGIDPYGPPQ
jgi:hypothetical protein